MLSLSQSTIGAVSTLITLISPYKYMRGTRMSQTRTSMKMEISRTKMVMRVAMLCCIMAMAAAAPLPLATFGESRLRTVDESPEAVETWFRYYLPFARPRLTKFRFYYHENRVSDHPTAVEIARANMTSQSPTSFGSTFAIDDPLTVSPDPNSQLVGRAQGIYTSASQTEMALLLEMNLVFTEGDFEGSTLSILGRDPIANEHRELPILGGSGVFRLARGTIITHTYSLDPETLSAIVEYNVFVEHYF